MTDDTETEAPETNVPETEEGLEGGRQTDVPETEGVFLNIVEGLSGCYCLISFVRCVWVERCVSLVDDSGGVCVDVGGWLVVLHGCVWWRRGWQKQHVLS